jgi:hypothetical protein
MTKLYDLFLDVNGNGGTFQMRAPLTVIVQTLMPVHCHDQTMLRLEHDTVDGGVAELHRNGRKWFVECAVEDLHTFIR